MLNRRLGIALFFFGVFLMVVHTILPFLWALVGIPFPYPLTSSSGILWVLPGFTPAIGSIVIVIAGLIYGREEVR